MVDIQVYDAKIFNKSKVTADIIKEYQLTGRVNIVLNHFEGPCCEALKLYSMLDNICDTFGFSKKNIQIITGNHEERHSEYTVTIDQPSTDYWLRYTYHGMQNCEQYKQKDVTKNLFGCLYNTPTWHRLCLLAHVSKLSNSSLKLCNPSLDAGAYNRVWLDHVVTEAPNEMNNIIKFLANGDYKTHSAPLNKKAFNPLDINSLYNDFFIDLVSETFVSGTCFFWTEKSVRPMLARTPFIVMGPVAFLSNLKHRYGFKTFDAWWDESYDNLQHYDRIQAIYKITDQLDTLTAEERQTMFAEMQPVLEHNYNRVLELNEQR